MWNIFIICSGCIIRQINVNVNIFSETSEWFRKVFTYFYTLASHQSFFINSTIKWITMLFPFDIQFITFSFKYFFYSKFFLISLLQFVFIKTSSNFFTIQITNSISPRNCIFNFINNKNFFWPIWSISFSKNVFIFWNSNMITNFKFRI